MREVLATIAALAVTGLWYWLDSAPTGSSAPSTTATTTAATECPTHLPKGLPQGPNQGKILVRDIYCLSNNPETKFADWVAYRLDSKTIGSGDEGEQDRVWAADPELPPGETLEPEDYTGAYKALKVDRGHLAPLADFRGANWQQVNFLSNIVPQDSTQNRGVWLEVEKLERSLGKQGEIFVIVGTVYERPMKPLPQADEAHEVPSGLWKVIDSGDVQAWLFEQDREYEGPEEAAIALEQLEQRTGWDFPQNGYQ